MKLVQLQKIRDPYNYCDRWCERCLTTKTCKVFKDNQKWRQKCIAQGKDPDTPEAAFQEVAECLHQTTDLIFKGAKKWGINPGSLLPKSEEEFNKYCDEQEEKSSEILAHPLYTLSLQLEDGYFDLLGNFDPQEVKADPDLETLQWYATLVPAKIFRALSENLAERWPLDGYDDRAVSLSIALRGVNTCHVSLQKLLGKHSLLATQIDSLIFQTQELKHNLEDYLNELSDFNLP